MLRRLINSSNRKSIVPLLLKLAMPTTAWRTGPHVQLTPPRFALNTTFKSTVIQHALKSPLVKKSLTIRDQNLQNFTTSGFFLGVQLGRPLSFKTPILICRWDLAEWYLYNVHCTLFSYTVAQCRKYTVTAKVANAAPEVATVLGSIPETSDTVESEGRQMKQCWKTNIKYF